MRKLLLIIFFCIIQSALSFAENTLIDFRLAHDQEIQGTTKIDDENLGVLFVEKTSIVQLGDIYQAKVIIDKEKPAWWLESAVNKSGGTILHPQIKIGIILNQKGTEEFSNFTENNIGRRIAVFIEDELMMAPRIMEKINSGQAIITTSFSKDEAQAVVDKINSNIAQD